MDKAQLIKWLVPVVARGISWIFVAKLGADAVEGSAWGTQIASGLGAAILLAASIYTSLAGRKKLLAQEPPK